MSAEIIRPDWQHLRIQATIRRANEGRALAMKTNAQIATTSALHAPTYTEGYLDNLEKVLDQQECLGARIVRRLSPGLFETVWGPSVKEEFEYLFKYGQQVPDSYPNPTYTHLPRSRSEARKARRHEAETSIGPAIC